MAFDENTPPNDDPESQEYQDWLEDGGIDPRTGQQLTGYLNTVTGEISLDPTEGFGENGIPLWGDAAREAKYARALELGEGVTNTSELSDSTYEGDWIFLEPGVQVHSSRYQQAKNDDGSVMMYEGKEVWAKDPKKTSGLFGDVLETVIPLIPAVAITEALTGEDLTDDIMGGLGTLLYWESTIIPDLDVLVGGSKMREDTMDLWDDAGLDAEDTLEFIGTANQVAGAVVTGVAIALTGGAYGAVAAGLAAAGISATKSMASVQAARLMGKDVDYGAAAEDAGIDAAVAGASAALLTKLSGIKSIQNPTLDPAMADLSALGVSPSTGLSTAVGNAGYVAGKGLLSAGATAAKGGSTEENLISGFGSSISSFSNLASDNPLVLGMTGASVAGISASLLDLSPEQVAAMALARGGMNYAFAGENIEIANNP